MHTISRKCLTLFALIACALILPHCAFSAEKNTYYLQAGTFSQSAHARKLAERVSKLSQHDATVKTIRYQNKMLYVVELAQFENEKQAIDAQTRLSQSAVSTQLRHHDASQKASKQSIQKTETISAQTKSNQVNKVNAPKIKPVLLSPRKHTAGVKKTARKKKQIKQAARSKRLWNLRDANIRTVINEVSRETGKNFLIDPRVQGKVSIISSTPLGSDEVYQVFLSMLQVAGYAAIPSGQIIKVVPNAELRSSANPVDSNLSPQKNGQVVTRVIPIKYVSAQQLVPILRPLMPQWSHISAYYPSNTIIMSGRADNLNRIVDIIRRVDLASENNIDVISLQNALAQDVVKTLKDLRTGQQSVGRPPVSVAADDRSNAVLVSGTRSQRLRMRVLITELDTPNPKGLSGNTQVVFLKFLRAEDVVPILAGVARAQFHGEVGTIIGTKAVDQGTQLEKKDSAAGDASAGNSPPLYGAGATSISANRQAQTANLKSSDSSKPRVEIIGEPNTNSIILNAPPALMRTLKNVVSKIDFRPEQVLVEALIVEIDESQISQLGIDWGTQVRSVNVETGLLSAQSAFRAGFGVLTQNGISDFEAQISALASERKADILSTPSVVVLDNHLAHIKVGKQVSIIDSNYPNNAQGTTTASPYNTFTRKDVALVLNVTPQITHNDGIKMTIAHQNDTLQNPEDTTDKPVFNISEIKTSVLVENGDVLVLGGLIQDQLSNSDRKIPIAGDFPGIGQLFHNRGRQREKKKLLVFLRTRIMKSRRDNLHISGEKYENQRQAQLASLRERPFRQSNDAVVLPRLEKALTLPAPFSRTPPLRTRYH